MPARPAAGRRARVVLTSRDSCNAFDPSSTAMGNACCGWVDPGAPSVVLDRQSVARMADAACCHDQQPAQAAVNRSCSQILPNLRVEDVYEFGRTLGSGGFSAVKLVSHRATGKQYACKIMLLPPPGVDVREDILREINILIALEHPNIVDLTECFFAGRPNLVRRSVQSLFAQPFSPLSDDGGGVYGEKVYLIMEVLHGGELLDAIMAKGSYTESDAWTIFCQIVSGLSYLHSRGVIHRDLKLSNLLLAQPGDITQVKIADFGLARSAAAAGDAVAAAGTPHYMAPEVVEAALQGHSSSPLSPACDIWSLGVCLFILLGGYPPFDDVDEQRLLRKIRRGRFSFHGQVWQTISHEAKDLIRQLLVLDPLKRPTAQQVMEHPWVGRGGFASKAAAASGASLSIDSDRMPGPHPAAAAGAPHESLLSQLLEGLREEEGAQ